MEETVKKKICDQPGCKILEGGSCLEGIDVSTGDCPHYILRDVSNLVIEASNTNTKPQTLIQKKKIAVQLFTGRELKQGQTTLITNSYDNRLIAVVGESECGKTTLLAEIFINLQKGKFCQYFFAGSYTQIGFEERAFQATLSSGNLKPKTERTKSKEFSFLHLMLKHENQLKDPASHLLFADISGETFRDAKTSTVLIKELTTLKSADFTILLIDGEKLAKLATRSLVIEEAKTFIQKAINENIFDKKTNLKVAIAKWDFLCDDDSFDWRVKIEQPFKQRFEQYLGVLDFTRIAARSDNSKVPAAFGICELLNEWLTSEINEDFVLPERSGKSSRSFHRYKFPI